MEMTQQEFAALRRLHLALFAERCFAHLNPGTPYIHNWHLDLIADRLERVARGEIKRLIINVPPRSMKSITASVAFPAWVLGHAPNKSLICVSYSQELSDKHAEDTRTIMQSSWYQALFPTRLSSKRPSLSFLKTFQGGGRRATSVGGTLTGLGADIILIDDPLKPGDARGAARKSANDWLDNTLLSRLNNKKEGAIVIIMQRLHLDDTVGHVLQHGGWDVVTLPAIAIEDERFSFQNWVGMQKHARKPGDVLQPEREPLEVLEALRKQMESGVVLFPHEASWLDVYIAEMTVFPNVRNDDQVDSTSQALGWMALPQQKIGMLVYCQQEMEKLRRCDADSFSFQ